MVRQMTSAVFSFVIQSSVSDFLFCLRQPNVRSCEQIGNSRRSGTPAGMFLVFMQSLYDYAKLVLQIRRNPLILHLLITSRRCYRFHSYFQLKTTPGVGHEDVYRTSSGTHRSVFRLSCLLHVQEWSWVAVRLFIIGESSWMKNGRDNLEAGGERCHVTCRGRDSQFVEDCFFPKWATRSCLTIIVAFCFVLACSDVVSDGYVSVRRQGATRERVDSL